ncbi:unnamed protein product [Euphydryas editha]|uniref:Uncharacterized protein n=1 Tax=Euphydryas editha TaxID=104508 RepID=A0AAU9UXW3_EUPED|nr:unnamed protein product [Euphydryas editha]
MLLSNLPPLSVNFIKQHYKNCGCSRGGIVARARIDRVRRTAAACIRIRESFVVPPVPYQTAETGLDPKPSLTPRPC